MSASFYFAKSNRYVLRLNPYIKKINVVTVSVIFFLVSLIFVLILARDFGIKIFTNPREVYTETRLGYGLIYFLGHIFVILFFILTSYWSKNIIIPAVLSIFLSYPLGTKTYVLQILVISLYMYVFMEGKKISFVKFTTIALTFLISLFLAFIVMTPYVTINHLSTMLYDFLNYSDYSRNFMLLLKYLKGFYFGQITLENNLFSLIPRMLFPDKPKIFGVFRLALEFYPSWTLGFTGAPSFGVFGGVFADFGWLSLLIIIFNATLSGFVIGILENTLEYRRNIIIFFYYITLVGVPLFTVGIDAFSVLVVNFLMVYILSLLLRMTIMK
jgi:hypothetical protein